MARLALVDDHTLVREAVAARLTGWGHEVVMSGPDLDQVIARDDVDLVVLDLDLGVAGIADDAAVAAVVNRGVGVIVLSALASARHVRRMVGAGCCAVVSKQDELADLQSAVDAALVGDMWMTPTLARAFLEDRGAGRPELSRKEIEALRLYACGMKLDTVARRMGIAPSTAKQYIDRVRHKYEVLGHRARTRSELYSAAVDDGFIPRDGPQVSC
ncbi:response regulator [Gordonia otitidis]|uniref:helix-turn-helix transcriptional regulator n=1 Tax=Gordonia otitidis TaxID=249058 RepID=UPI001D1455F0|nr:response regulator [Gordonia otitidis]UEA60756.1 response regulator [Gordonia otitidis]